MEAQISQPEKQQYKRAMPQSELDFYMQTINPFWGDDNTSPDLKERLNQYFLKRDERGIPLYTKDGQLIGNTASLWSMLSYFTRDIRLGNLNEWTGEVAYCQYYLDLAGDLLQANMLGAFTIALSRVAALLELSQSKKGFLRRQMNTLRTENLQGEIEPPKKKLFGGGKSYNYD